MNASEVARMLAYAGACYPSYAVTRETVLVYADLLADIDADEAMEAMRHHLATKDRWPTVAAIRGHIAAKRGALAPTKGEAWQQVQQAVKSKRTSGLHPLVQTAVDQIGWYEIRHAMNQETLRSQFWRVYSEVAEPSDARVIGTPGAIEAATRAPELLPVHDEEPQLVDEPAPPVADPEVARAAIDHIREQIAAARRRDEDAGLTTKGTA